MESREFFASPLGLPSKGSVIRGLLWCVDAPLLQLLDFGERTFLRNSPGRMVAPSEKLLPQAIEGQIVTI